MMRALAAVWLFAVLLLPGPVLSQPDSRGELTLQDVVARVLERNLAVEAARHRVSIAQAERIAARLWPNPTLTLTAENLKVSGPTAAGDLYEVGATYSHPIELGDKRQRRIAVAEAALSVAEAELADVLQQRVVEAKRAFFDVLLAERGVEHARENRSGFDELLAFNQVRLEEGAIAESEVVKVRLERLKFDSALAQAGLAVRHTGIKLLEVLGDAEFTVLPSVSGDLRSTVSPPHLEALKHTALRQRASVRVAAGTVALAERRVALERARVTPDLAPFVGAKRVGENNTVLFGLSVLLPIANRNQGAIARAEAEERVARTELAVQQRRVLAEVESAYQAWQTAQGRVIAFETGLLQDADQSVDIALAAYREGATELLGYLEAQRTRADVREQYTRTLHEARVSLLLLELAVGEALIR
jgi:outer membrane protein, heavy metal efflux system